MKKIKSTKRLTCIKKYWNFKNIKGGRNMRFLSDMVKPVVAGALGGGGGNSFY